MKTLGYVTGVAIPFDTLSSPRAAESWSRGERYRLTVRAGAFSAIARRVRRGCLRIPLWLSHLQTAEIGEVETLRETQSGLLFSGRVQDSELARCLPRAREIGVSAGFKGNALVSRGGQVIAEYDEATELTEVSLLTRTRPAFAGARAEFSLARTGHASLDAAKELLWFEIGG